MAHKIHGQHEGRQQRVEEYQKWSGATPVGAQGQVMEPSNEPNQREVDSAVEMIVASIRNGVEHIEYSIVHEPTRLAIQSKLENKLTESELTKVFL